MADGTDLDGSNFPVDLAARVRAEHEATSAALKSSVEHAMAANVTKRLWEIIDIVDALEAWENST
jgi:hypothetical protein